MIKLLYRDIPENEFVPICGVEEVFIHNYEINKLGQIRHIKNGIKTQSINGNYKIVVLEAGKDKKKSYKVHILVAKTFIVNDNPRENFLVDHIDRDTFNNSVNNLRWVSPKENRLNSKDTSKKFMYYRVKDADGNLLREVSSLEFSKEERVKIAKAINRKNKYNGVYWERFDFEVNELLKSIGKEEKDLVFVESSRDKNILCDINGVFKIVSKGCITLGTLRPNRHRKINTYSADRLIFETFSGITLSDKDEIDHINTNPSDNRFENLRLCKSRSENMKNPETIRKLSKGVNQFDMNGNFIKTFSSIKEAGESLSIKTTHISSCCTGKRKSSGGFIWKYKD